MPVYVTDTHSLVWYFTRQHRSLSRRALTAFEQAENEESFIYIPTVCLWEISRHERQGIIRLNTSFEDWLDALLVLPCFDAVPLDEQVIVEARKFNFNRDVFDAAIVATARIKDLPLITKDQAISDSGVVEIWW